ncbi:hypothetical protein ACHAW5_003849 [Stephanodiscus triporus]|uniref:Plastid lipid-associated protein/fibrillin conserved domain-containing protein n=1 Tax=Stephanodiscus triporus TaxID=2934178 RepID=A0ABD3NND3_9STRA
MFRIISLALSLIAAADAAGYPYMPLELGPWGVEPSIVSTSNAVRTADANADIKKVKKTSRKVLSDKKDMPPKAKVFANGEKVIDELEQAEESFFHAVENVEDAIIHAIDDEVEMLFPHHQKPVDE